MNGYDSYDGNGIDEDHSVLVSMMVVVVVVVVDW